MYTPTLVPVPPLHRPLRVIIQDQSTSAASTTDYEVESALSRSSQSGVMSSNRLHLDNIHDAVLSHDHDDDSDTMWEYLVTRQSDDNAQLSTSSSSLSSPALPPWTQHNQPDSDSDSTTPTFVMFNGGQDHDMMLHDDEDEEEDDDRHMDHTGTVDGQIPTNHFSNFLHSLHNDDREDDPGPLPLSAAATATAHWPGLIFEAPLNSSPPLATTLSNIQPPSTGLHGLNASNDHFPPFYSTSLARFQDPSSARSSTSFLKPGAVFLGHQSFESSMPHSTATSYNANLHQQRPTSASAGTSDHHAYRTRERRTTAHLPGSSSLSMTSWPHLSSSTGGQSSSHTSRLHFPAAPSSYYGWTEGRDSGVEHNNSGSTGNNPGQFLSGDSTMHQHQDELPVNGEAALSPSSLARARADRDVQEIRSRIAHLRRLNQQGLLDRDQERGRLEAEARADEVLEHWARLPLPSMNGAATMSMSHDGDDRASNNSSASEIGSRRSGDSRLPADDATAAQRRVSASRGGTNRLRTHRVMPLPPAYPTVFQTSRPPNVSHDHSRDSRAKESWGVRVVIQSYDPKRGTLNGLMHALGVPSTEKDIITTFFSGEIIDFRPDRNHGGGTRRGYGTGHGGKTPHKRRRSATGDDSGNVEEEEDGHNESGPRSDDVGNNVDSEFASWTKSKWAPIEPTGRTFQGPKSGPSREDRYWTKLGPFRGLSPDVLASHRHDSAWLESRTQGWIIMRWKELGFVNVQPGSCTLSIDGMYLVALERCTGRLEGECQSLVGPDFWSVDNIVRIRLLISIDTSRGTLARAGLYCDPNTPPYQRLDLAPMGPMSESSSGSGKQHAPTQSQVLNSSAPFVLGTFDFL